MTKRTELRLSGIIALLVACQALFAAAPRSACELLSAAEISTITEEVMQAVSHRAMPADHPTCKFTGRRTTLLVSVIEAETQSAASREFTHELDRTANSTHSDEPLRGVGVEARYRPASTEDGGTIVARFGTVVIVLSGNLDRATLVQLARAAAAHL